MGKKKEVETGGKLLMAGFSPLRTCCRVSAILLRISLSLRSPGSWHTLKGVKVVLWGRAQLQKYCIQNRNIKYRNSWSAEYLSHLKGLSISQKPNFLEESCVCVWVCLGEEGYCWNSVHLAEVIPWSWAGLGLWHGCAVSGGAGPEELPKIRRFSGSVLMALALCHAQKPFCPGERMEWSLLLPKDRNIWVRTRL